MAFSCFHYDSIKSGVFGTSLGCVLAQREPVAASAKKHKIFCDVNWMNMGNYSTAAGTSGTGGTTIIAAGNYTWIG